MVEVYHAFRTLHAFLLNRFPIAAVAQLIKQPRLLKCQVGKRTVIQVKVLTSTLSRVIPLIQQEMSRQYLLFLQELEPEGEVVRGVEEVVVEVGVEVMVETEIEFKVAGIKVVMTEAKEDGTKEATIGIKVDTTKGEMKESKEVDGIEVVKTEIMEVAGIEVVKTETGAKVVVGIKVTGKEVGVVTETKGTMTKVNLQGDTMAEVEEGIIIIDRGKCPLLLPVSAGF